jgi:flagellar basal body-associated protein FliL
MDASRRPPKSRQYESGVRTRKTRWLALLSGLLVLLLGMTLQTFGFSQTNSQYTAYSAPRTLFGTTATATATATQPSNPPTLLLSVPASGQGPVGAHITVIGSNWGTADVLVGVAAPGASCANVGGWAQTFSHVRPAADQGIVFTFDWPSNLTASGNAYSICASNSAGTASTLYQLLALSKPSLTIDPTTAPAGSLVNVTGANFVGSGNVTLSVTDAQGSTRKLTTLPPDASGSFSLTFQPRTTDVGQVTLKASTSAPQGIKPALDATAPLQVEAATTPTPGATPTVATTLPTQPTGNNNSTLVLIVVIVALILVALLVVTGVVFFLIRKRNNPENGSSYASGYYDGGNPGYGRPGNIYGDLNQNNGYSGGLGNMGNTEWDAPTQGYSSYQQGVPPPEPSEPSYGNNAGGWPETDEPDPGWHPRPMTGQWRAPEGYGDAPYGNYGAENSGNYPPQDPWGNPENTYGQPRQPGQSHGTGHGRAYPPADPRGRSSGGGSGRGPTRGTRDAPRGRYPEQPPDDEW